MHIVGAAAAAFGPKAKENRTRNRNMGEAHERTNTNTHTHTLGPRTQSPAQQETNTRALWQRFWFAFWFWGIHGGQSDATVAATDQPAKWLQLTGCLGAR